MGKLQIIKSASCPSCGCEKFKQEVVEIYNRYLNGKKEVTGSEDELTHDYEYGAIRCLNCGFDCGALIGSID